ncbi:MAG: tetratricopeptide repeat protein [Melioribacter sp.]|nr:tetratricopeptide repeat protein [Melioribacter sp.]
MKKIILCLLIYTFSISAQDLPDNFTSGLNAYNSRDFGTAYKLFSTAINRKELNKLQLITAKFYSANCLLNLDQLDGAASEFESFIDQYKFSDYRESVIYTLGTIYYKKGEYRKARERLTYLINEYPSNEFTGTSYYWLGESYLAEEKYIDAEENFKNAITQKRTNKFIVNSIYSLAQVYEKSNNYKKAVEEYDELLAYYKDHELGPKSQMRIGICYFILKDYDNAILELNDPLIKQLPKQELIESKYFLASSFVRLKEYNEATQVYNELLANVSDKSNRDKISYSLAWINFQQEKYDDAYKLFKELADTGLDSLKSDALFWSGESKRYLGDTKTANDIFKDFISKYPGHHLASRAQLGIGSTLIAQSDGPDAEKALLNATISNDKQTRGKAYTLLGESRLNKKNYTDAKKYFSEALKLTQEQSELKNRSLLGLSVSDYYLNNYDLSIKNLEELRLRSKEFEPDKVNFYLAESYFQQAKFSAALKSYNSISPNSESLKQQTILGKAYTYFNLKDFTNSIYYFNEYLSKYKNDQNTNEYTLRLADSYFGMKNFAKASAIYRELFSKEKTVLNNDLAYYQYGQSLFKSGKANEAMDAFEKLQEKYPNSKYTDQSQYIIGWIHFQQNDFNNAIYSYKSLLNKYPRSSMRPIVYNSIGDSYYNSGQYDSSIVFYSKVLSEFPATQYIFDAVSGIQYSYVAKEQPDEAIKFIDQFISSNPNSKYSDQIFFKKGDLYYSIQDYNSAIRSYKEFITNYPNSSLIPNAYYWIGKSAANMKDETEAINNFNFAKSRSLKSEIGISSVLELARIYSDKKQYSSAVNVLKEASDAVPTSNRVPELLYQQGVNQVKDNKIDEASSTFDQIINYYEGSIFVSKAKVELGVIELQKNNYENAQALFKEVSEKRTDDIGAEAQYYYGVLLYNQNKIEDAITSLVRVRSVFAAYDEWYTKSLLKLGDCYIKLKDKKQAREMYRAVLSRHDSGEFADEAKKKIKQL